MTRIQSLWQSEDSATWEDALSKYWDYVKPENLALEHEMDQLDASAVQGMNSQEWYDFLLLKYFKWKFTAANRYATTTKHLRSYAESGLEPLRVIKEEVFQVQSGDIEEGISAAKKIPGLGTAGASGLLSLLFPHEYGTVDQFVVKALAQVPTLLELDLVSAMNPESLSASDGLVLIRIMKKKSLVLNESFGTDSWTPRKIDMVLWATRD